MPEGDTVWRTAQRLHQALAGREVVLWDLRFPDIATSDLRGATTLEVVSRGKHLLHRLDAGVTVHSHLRMEGQWRVQSTPDAGRWLRRADLRAAVGTPAWTALGLRLGMLDLVATSREADLVGHLGPDLLGPDWDAVVAAANLRADGAAVGAALLDQRNLAGVGTFWAAESLFVQRVNPWVPAAELAAPALEALVARVHRMIDAGRRHAVQSSTGALQTGEHSFVHGRSGRPCRRCGEPVRVASIAAPPRERVLFYCPHCQRGLAPSDDGVAQAPLGTPGQAGRQHTLSSRR